MTVSYNIKLDTNNSGQLTVTTQDGIVHCPVKVVRAFPVSSNPDEHISIIGESGKELVWLDSLDSFTQSERELINDALSLSNRFHKITRIRSISSSNVPCTWVVETPNEEIEFVLENEEDITCMNNELFLIKDRKEYFYLLPHIASLDKNSLKLVEPFIF